jgi:imidazoleglycerol phosphate dehydratase HisB
VSARNKFVVACKFERAFIGTLNANLGQTLRHFFGTLAAAAAMAA